MRPDEHKKKKNAAYKKKHGIGQAKQQEDDAKKTKSNPSTDKHSKSGHREGPNNKSREAPTQKKEPENHGSSSSDSESKAEVSKQPKRNFKRREIVSNWQKYELPSSEDVKLEARGESFERLLSMAGDAMAHFRFKDEQEWDMEGSQMQVNSGADLFQQYMNIDTHQLGQALACLPLHTVLDIDPEVFPTDELEQMENVATENRKLYMQMQPQPAYPKSSSSAHDPSLSPSDITCSLQKKDKPAADLSRDDSISSGNYSKTTMHGQHTDTLTTVLNASQTKVETPPHDNNNENSHDIQSNACQKLSLADEDLDALLDLDEDSPDVLNSTDVSQPSLQRKSDSTSEKLSRELESAATVSHPRDHTTETKLLPDAQTKNNDLEKSQKDGVDLEDWLDGILDD